MITVITTNVSGRRKLSTLTYQNEEVIKMLLMRKVRILWDTLRSSAQHIAQYLTELVCFRASHLFVAGQERGRARNRKDDRQADWQTGVGRDSRLILHQQTCLSYKRKRKHSFCNVGLTSRTLKNISGGQLANVSGGP